MARPPQITRENLTPLIRSRGPVSATELAGLLRVNRTTIARTLPVFGDELVTLGATRSTRYLLRRGIRSIGSRWTLYRVDAGGRAGEWAELEALHERLWRVNWAGNPPEWAGLFMEENGLWSGFPFSLVMPGHRDFSDGPSLAGFRGPCNFLMIRELGVTRTC